VSNDHRTRNFNGQQVRYTYGHHVVDLVSPALRLLGRGGVADEGVGAARGGVGAHHGVGLEQKREEEAADFLL
jgi:hypothetical protein